jgi:hypothetical protein
MTEPEGTAGADAPGTIKGGRRVALGCFTAILGTASGGMIAVLVSKFVAFLVRAESCPGVPTCDWYVYWLVGALIGGISLPWLVLRAISRPKKTT